MYSVYDDPKGPGFPIRKSADQRLLTPPHSLSQRATSFIASQRQGIHQMLLKRLITLVIANAQKIISKLTISQTFANREDQKDLL